MSSEFLRLFVAIFVPEALREKLATVQDELRPLAAPRDVRWTPPEQLHLTLKFLGRVPNASLEDVKSSLAAASAGGKRFSLCVRGIGFFPDSRSPRVIWAGFDEQKALSDLQRKIAESLAAFAKKPDSETFLPHATLGRFQKFRRHKTERLMERASKFGNECFGEFCAETIELFRSETLPSGARHIVLSSFRLE